MEGGSSILSYSSKAVNEMISQSQPCARERAAIQTAAIRDPGGPRRATQRERGGGERRERDGERERNGERERFFPEMHSGALLL